MAFLVGNSPLYSIEIHDLFMGKIRFIVGHTML